MSIVSLKWWMKSGHQGVKYVDINTHLRSNFLNILARMFAGHENFWDGKKLVIDGRVRQKIEIVRA